METNRILTADLLDIIFDGRNKSYGAYDLRKTYPERVKRALAIMLSLCLVLVVGTLLANSFKKAPTNQDLVRDIVLENLPPDVKKIDPPPPPKPPTPPEVPKIRMDIFTPPEIVTEEIPDDKQMKTMDELDHSVIGKIHQDGDPYDGTITAPPTEITGTGGKVTLTEKKEDYDDNMIPVQFEAEFPGGKAAWSKYLERNLNSNLPTDNGAPAGKYSVTVSFVVDKDGNISDVQTENNPGFGTTDEAVRIIKKGPKWKPAVQNGRNVAYRVRQQITFRVDEG